MKKTQDKDNEKPLLDFRWDVEVDGYALVTEVAVFNGSSHEYNPDTGLVGVGEAEVKKPENHVWISPVGGPRRSISPLSDEGLHRNFAEQGASDDAIVKLANTYGLLGPYTFMLEHPDGFVTFGESLSWFRQDVIKLRFLLSLWDKVNSGEGDVDSFIRDRLDLANSGSFFDDQKRRNVVRSLQPMVRCAEATEFGLTIPSFDYSYAFSNSFANHGLDIKPSIAAVLFIREQVNRVLAKYVSPAIRSWKSPRYGLVAKNLLGAIYLSFANEITGQAKEMRRCGGCGRWFYPNTARQQFCDASCKLRYHRRIKKELGDKVNEQ